MGGTRSPRQRIVGAAKEARALLVPLVRETKGRLGTHLNDVAVQLGRERSFAEPIGLQWRRILSNSDTLRLRAPEGGPRVMLAVGYGLSGTKLAFETILAAALKLRGAQVRVMLCDATLVACEFNPVGGHDPAPVGTIPGVAEDLGPRARSAFCDGCRGGIRSAFSALDVAETSLLQYMHADDFARLAEIVDRIPYADYRSARYRDVAVGEHAFASMLRLTLRGTLLDDDVTRAQFRRVLLSTMHYVDLLDRMFAAERPDHIVAIHGVYLMHGTITEVARKHGIPVVIWGMPYRSGTVWLSHDDSYHRTLVTEPTRLWEDHVLTAAEDAEVQDYLDSKRGGGRDYVSYHPNPIEDRRRILDELGLDPDRPVITMFTNVIWDAQIYYDFNAFENMLDWVYSTIEHFGRRPEVQLVIRVHPAEVKGGGMPTKQPIVAEIAHRFPQLPGNVTLVPPESDVSSYTLAEMSTAALIYGTKMGLEIAVRGIPVVVAGETFNRGKGFTHDIQSREQYFELLDRIEHLPPNTPAMVERARRYAHYLYFRRMMDFPLLAVADPHRSRGIWLRFESLEELQPGRDKTLDVVCDGILQRRAFVLEPRGAVGSAA